MSTVDPQYFTPYPVAGRSDRALTIPPGQRNITSGSADREIGLQEGVNRVLLEWQGVKPLNVRFRPASKDTSSVIKVLDPGTTVMITIPTKEPGNLWFTQSSVDVSDEQYYLAVTVIPGPPVGAGGG